AQCARDQYGGDDQRAEDGRARSGGPAGHCGRWLETEFPGADGGSLVRLWIVAPLTGGQDPGTSECGLLDHPGRTIGCEDRDPEECYRGETRAQLVIATVMSMIAIGGLVAANWLMRLVTG